MGCFILLIIIYYSGKAWSYCSTGNQQSITRCAQPLYEIGAFGADHSSKTFTWEIFAKKNRQHFTEVCDAFQRFENCAEDHKKLCFDEEPIKSQYQTAIVILDYLCNDAYEEMLKSFDCFTITLESQEMTECQSSMMLETQQISNSMTEEQQGDKVCNIMQRYMACIKPIFNDKCGKAASTLVKEVIRRPALLVLPTCTLSSTGLIPSFCIVLIFYILSLFF